MTDTTDSGDPQITIQNNIPAIPKNKHDPLLRNYQSGNVRLLVYVNRFCPFTKKFLVEDTVKFNYETMKAYPDNVMNYLSTVKGLEGVYLKEKYVYLSNFLENKNNEPIDQAYEDIQTSGEYGDEQTWKIVDSVFDGSGSSPGSSSGSSEGDSNETGPIDEEGALELDGVNNRAVWRYFRENENIENNAVGADKNNENPNELPDAKVLYIGQIAATADNVKGIHWRAQKKTPLFVGEDFCLAFRKRVVATDISNIEAVPFSDHNYDALDVLYEGSGEAPPKNQGVISYRDTGDGIVKEEETIYNFCNQAYYVIQIGDVPSPSDQAIFLIITQKGWPTAVLVGSNGVGYNLGNYTARTGESLINSDKFTVTVRNHLGYIVVTFDGNNEEPWILNFPREKVKDEGLENDRNSLFLAIQEETISVWGGNIASSFCFFPLVYKEDYQFLAPPKPKTTANENATQEEPKYQVPAKGILKNLVLLSSVDVPLYDEANPPVGASGFASDLTSVYTTNRKPIFTCDSQRVQEIEIFLDNDGTDDFADWDVFPTTSPSYFSTLDGYLKAGVDSGDCTTEPDEDIASAIYLTATNLEYEAVADHEYGSVINFKLNVRLKAGHMALGGRTLNYCKTPIFTGARFVSIPEEAAAWNASMIDVSPLVMKFSDSYSAPDWHSIQHTGSLTFLLNKGMPGQLGTLATQLDALRKKSFYVEIWAGYDTCNYSKLNVSEGYKLFTGICYGGSLSESAGERTMTCQVYDYTKVLEQSFIFNSPFFDGMRDFSAVYEIAKMASFREDITSSGFGPAILIKQQASSDLAQINIPTPDGRGSYSDIYVLPNSYNRLKEPFFKYQDGTPIWDVLQQIAKRAGKVVFFDSYGILHYENNTFDSYFFGNGSANDVPVLWKFTKKPDGDGQLVFESLTRERSVEDCINVIHLITSTPDRELAINDSVNWASVYDPSSPGFLGYKKLFLQQEGIFGNEKSLENLSKHYKKFFHAPIIYKFKTYGLPVRALDVCSLDGQKLVITSVQAEIDGKTNQWMMDVEGEWYGQEETITT